MGPGGPGGRRPAAGGMHQSYGPNMGMHGPHVHRACMGPTVTGPGMGMGPAAPPPRRPRAPPGGPQGRAAVLAL